MDAKSITACHSTGSLPSLLLASIMSSVASRKHREAASACRLNRAEAAAAMSMVMSFRLFLPSATLQTLLGLSSNAKKCGTPLRRSDHSLGLLTSGDN